MKTIRSTILMLLMVVSLSSMAQKVNPKIQEMLDERLNDMIEVMDLDESQQTKVKELNLQEFFKRKKVRKEHEKGSEEFKSANKVITKQYHQDLRSICSNEQMKAFFAYKKEKQKSKKK